MNYRKVFSLLPMIIFLFIIWYFLMAGTSAVVNVVSVNKREIVIQNMSGDQNTVTIPKGIYKLIDVNEEYFISYNSRIGQKPFLTSIEPSAK
ncbi:hypothetical protein BSK49_27655 [Paenibacillus odorifer]|jgi:hypothetical protein|uniref:NusG domain-containing protein n=2 Tax=Paenibacillus TaxID=44249 RepID=A0ABX3GJT4_9BACL|nr:hypothetical protein [Paenibacillus odorifer]OMD25523.1 hypothetical protein BSO21_21030 [Paenibacillus odorifer]OMD81047.1 hypothetical protein BSK49_27655 [Paenibacillus odorifer]